MTLDSIVGTILVRDHYRWVRMQYMSRMLTALAAAVLLSFMGTVWLVSKPPQFRYILTNPSGNILPMVPLDQPNMDDAQILQWTVDAMARLYTFDFLNYQRQFQKAQNDVTVTGWKWFEDSMINSGNFNSILQQRFVTTARPNGPARILEKDLLSDAASGQTRFVWTIEVPITISYQSSKQTTTQDVIFLVTVLRTPEFVNHTGVQIRQMVGRPG